MSLSFYVVKNSCAVVKSETSKNTCAIDDKQLEHRRIRSNAVLNHTLLSFSFC